MSEMPIDQKSRWQRKHLNSIQMSYSKAPHFKELFPKLQELYSVDYDNLVDATWDHLMFWLDVLDIHTKVIKSSSLDVSSKKSDFVFDLCKAVDADYYIAGAMGKDYLETEKFNKAGITLEFQDYKHPVYPQLHGEFLPNMGIVDFAMNSEDYSII